jgi:prolyl oligopeptidase
LAANGRSNAAFFVRRSGIQMDKPNLDFPDVDPFLDLEDVDGARALSWVEGQNTRSVGHFGGDKIASDVKALIEIFTRPDRIAHVRRRGGFLYNFWRDDKNIRGCLRRTTFESYCTESPDWEVILDIDELARSENEDWVYSGAESLPGSSEHAILRLSRGGSDAVVLREFNRETRQFVSDGFNLPEAKGSACWVDADTVLLFSAYGGEKFTTDAGYARTVRHWRRGQSVEEAAIVFETDRKAMGAGAAIDARHPDRTIYFIDQIDFFNCKTYLFRDGKCILFDVPTDSWTAFDNDLMVVKPRTSNNHNGTEYTADTLMVISRNAFIEGNRDYTTLFIPSARKSLQSFDFIDGKILVHFKENLKSRYDLWSIASGAWVRLPLPTMPETGEINLDAFDAEASESNGDMLLSINDPVTPPTVYLIETGTTVPQVLKRSPANFIAEGIKVTHHEAISVDGERIPYVQIGPETPNGDAPVHMTGYGGFGMAEEPRYDSVMGKLWLERGGTCVVTHIRGGGEFGTAWHDAGRLANKKLSHDDFAAVATDLVKRGVTNPKRIAAEGGSNGGLLIANMLVRYPERFGALFCTIPLTDMRRYTKLLAGASWIAEYGDPDKPEDWAFIQHFSAYHLARQGLTYPPILIASSRADDRVHPGHGRKFAAKLQALGHDAHYYEPESGGHNYGKDHDQTARFMAMGLRFLAENINWVIDANH